MPDRSEDRAEVRAAIAEGGLAGPSALADRLRADGLDLAPDEVRRHLRALGAVRVEGSDGPVLAVPLARPGGSGPGSDGTLRSADGDPDRTTALAVVGVVALFALLGLLGWLLA